MKFETQNPHPDKGNDHGEGDNGAHDESGTQPQENHHHSKHSDQRLQEVHGHAVNRLLYILRLIEGNVHLITDGQPVLPLLNSFLNPGSEIQDVHACLHLFHGQDDGGLPVVVNFLHRRINVGALHCGYIFQVGDLVG